MPDPLPTCSHCGTQAAPCDGVESGVPDGWSRAREGRRVMLSCPACVRANIRSIEAKLSEEWWDR